MTISFDIDDNDAQRIIDGIAIMGNYQPEITAEDGKVSEVSKEDFLQEYIVKLIKHNVNIAESNSAFNLVKETIDSELAAIAITPSIPVPIKPIIIKG